MTPLTVRFATSVSALVLAAVIPLSSGSAQQAASSKPLPFDPAVTAGTLSNGMRYYIRENHKPEKRAELRMVVDAGSVLEDEDQRRLAHLVQPMALQGTAKDAKSH